jgi:lipid-binding SYLF domain-containing protein
MSYLARAYTELSSAVSDAYGSLLHQDDAGKSARLVFVARPKAVALDPRGNAYSGGTLAANGAAGNGDSAPGNGEPLRELVRYDLGMSFVEINGRAYVRSVVPDSDAAMAGVRPRDCLQLASVVVDVDAGRGDEAKAAQVALGMERKGRRTDYNELRLVFGTSAVVVAPADGEDDEEEVADRGRGDAGEAEAASGAGAGAGSRGVAARVDALSLGDAVGGQEDGGSSKNAKRGRSGIGGEARDPSSPRGAGKRREPFESPPSVRQSSTAQSVLQTCSQAASGQCGVALDDQLPGDAEGTVHAVGPGPNGSPGRYINPASTDGTALHPVVLVFRRTRQRQSLGYGSHIAVPPFRLDDECDRAALLLRSLAPSDETEPVVTAWDEIVEDMSEWLLPRGSILPPEEIDGPSVQTNTASPSSIKMAAMAGTGAGDMAAQGGRMNVGKDRLSSHDSIPLDALEAKSIEKLSRTQRRMMAEALRRKEDQKALEAKAKARGESGPADTAADDAEAATLRGLIQKAAGLAFIRSSKVVMGVSVHGGSGIVIARLPDGTWSAPSAIGSWGIGLGLQFGVELADYIFILNTQDALEHFRQGGNFTVGGNLGAAVLGVGREAYGATSVKGALCVGEKDVIDDLDYLPASPLHPSKKYDAAGLAPIIAYAKSQGLYIGVSLEGSKLYTREEINDRTYKFASGHAVSAEEILSGTVPTPPEAEELYAALHQVEYAHEIEGLPSPLEVLKKDVHNDWRFDRTNSPELDEDHRETSRGTVVLPFSFMENMNNMTQVESVEMHDFETKFKKFLYGGVSVQRLVPNAERGAKGKTRRERRTLWLMLPEVGSLRLGFVSKLSDGNGGDSGKMFRAKGSFRRRQLAGRRSSDDEDDDGDDDATNFTYDTLDDTTVGSRPELDDDDIAQTSGRIVPGNVRLSSKYSVALSDVTMLSQEPHVSIRYNRDDATEHLRVISIQDVSGTSLLFLANNFREAELLVCGLKLLLERETSRLGVRGGVPVSELGGTMSRGAMSPATARGYRANVSEDIGRPASPIGNLAEGFVKNFDNTDASLVPDGRQSWSQVPGRRYMRQQAAPQSPDTAAIRSEGYVHGQLLSREITGNIALDLPIQLCRSLLLDSSSPLMVKWETDRGDTNYVKTKWKLPLSSRRGGDRHKSDGELISSGSMSGAERMIEFDRPRNVGFVPLSEKQIVGVDESDMLSYTVVEMMPRRGFSVRVIVSVRPTGPRSCEANIAAELRPIGKNMSNQMAVHKAFLLVLAEIRARYGTENRGLLAGLLNFVDTRPPNSPGRSGHGQQQRRYLNPQAQPDASVTSQPQSKSGLTSFQELLAQNHSAGESKAAARVFKARNGPRQKNDTGLDRPRTPSMDGSRNGGSSNINRSSSPDSPEPTKPQTQTIEVKPLPKIRLDLLPSPREEDEVRSERRSTRSRRGRRSKREKI